MNKTTDFHIHTLVSDGNATPEQMLQAAKEAGVGRLSFTDHDALGAYRHWGDVFAYAKDLGIELIAGIELDTDYQNQEIHLLGYGFNLDDNPLNKYLYLTQKLRKEKVMLQIAIINRFFGRQVIDLDQVLFPSPSSPLAPRLPLRTDKSYPPKTSDNLCCPLPSASEPMSVRDTLMKPHLVHAMLAQGLFSEYRAANYWLSQNARVPVVVPKLALAAAINMIRNAGGEAVLAHPGYLVRENGFVLEALLNELVPLGLSGLEVDYPYLGSSPKFSDSETEQKFIEELRALTIGFKLKETRGSDAHDTGALKKFANKSIPQTSLVF